MKPSTISHNSQAAVSVSSSRQKRIHVLCVDDHRIVREGIELIINRQPDMQVIASAATGEEACKMFEAHHPDVTLMDLQLGTMSGVDAIRRIKQKHHDAHIIVLTVYEGDEDIFRALEAGATTYLLKDTLSDNLIDVVRQINEGKEPPISEKLAKRLAERASGASLSPREVEIVKLMSSGMRNKEIGASLGISEATAQVHARNIFAKLGVRDRTAAVTVALRRGIIHMGETIRHGQND